MVIHPCTRNSHQDPAPDPRGGQSVSFCRFFHWFTDAWLALRWVAPASHSPHAGIGHKRQGAVGDGFDGEGTFLSPFWGLSVQAAVSVCKKPNFSFLDREFFLWLSQNSLVVLLCFDYISYWGLPTVEICGLCSVSPVRDSSFPPFISLCLFSPLFLWCWGWSPGPWTCLLVFYPRPANILAFIFWHRCVQCEG